MTREAGDNEAIAPTFTNFGLLENLFVQKFSSKNAKFGTKNPILEKFQYSTNNYESKFLQTLCQFFAAVFPR